MIDDMATGRPTELPIPETVAKQLFDTIAEAYGPEFLAQLAPGLMTEFAILTGGLYGIGANNGHPVNIEELSKHVAHDVENGLTQSYQVMTESLQPKKHILN